MARGASAESKPVHGRRGYAVFLMILPITVLASCAVTAPDHFTEPQARDRFTPCPSAPHCVSSQASGISPRHVAPFRYTSDTKQARQALLDVLRNSDKAKVVSNEDTFVHATFHTTVGFVDDVTFIVHPNKKYIDVKSSSRVGYYDFGVNRRRVERLRKQFQTRVSR